MSIFIARETETRSFIVKIIFISMFLYILRFIDVQVMYSIFYSRLELIILVFISPISIAYTSLGEERANLCAFRMFVRFVLVWFCWSPLPLGVQKGLQFVVVALPGLFSCASAISRHWPNIVMYRGIGI